MRTIAAVASLLATISFAAVDIAAVPISPWPYVLWCVVWTLTGAVLAVRRPANLIGWFSLLLLCPLGRIPIVATAVFIPVGLLTSADMAGTSVIAILIGLFAMPIAVGVAILRYRLYEIDALISRTLVYEWST